MGRPLKVGLKLKRAATATALPAGERHPSSPSISTALTRAFPFSKMKQGRRNGRSEAKGEKLDTVSFIRIGKPCGFDIEVCQ